MLRWAVLLQVLLWISTAHAFFPWFPAKICAEDDTLCKAQAAEAAASARQERSVSETGVRFRLSRKQRSAQIDQSEPLHERVKRIAHRLTTKHGRTANQHQRQQPRSPPTPTAVELEKRSNAFSVVPAATPSATNAAGIDQDGTDFAYFVEAAIGSEKTPMYMLLDTGAGTTWVMGNTCSSSACSLHNEFGPDDSKTLQTSDESFKISYGSGTVSGSLASDTLSIASLSVTMSFGLANTTSDDFSHFPFDGILGLSLSRGATDNFWQTIQGASLLPANIFCVALWRATASGTNTGEIIFGATDPDQYTGDIVYTDVASANAGDWAIPMDGMGYNGKDAGIQDRDAYIDTGTTYVFGPSADVAKLHALIPGSSSKDGVTYTVPCADPQPLTVTFSGVTYTIDPADWLADSADDSGNCTSNIYGYAVVQDAWLLGDLFLKNVYAAFDVDKKRIGFASRADVSAPTSSSSSATSSPTANASTTATPKPTTSGSSSASSVEPVSVRPVGGSETTATTAAPSPAQTTPGTSAGPQPTTVTSPAGRLDGKNIYASIACVVAALALAA